MPDKGYPLSCADVKRNIVKGILLRSLISKADLIKVDIGAYGRRWYGVFGILYLRLIVKEKAHVVKEKRMFTEFGKGRNKVAECP